MEFNITLLVFGLFGVVMFTIGYYFGKKENQAFPREEIYKFIDKGTGETVPLATKPRPGGIFYDPKIPSGPVHRPDAKTINRWNEDQRIKGEKEALSESFALDPELVEIRRKREQFASSAVKH